MIKTEYREKTVKEKYPVYIASDGKEFLNISNAKLYEAQLMMDNRHINTASILTCENEELAELFHLKSFDDFKYINDTKWFKQNLDDWKQPGWYISIRHDGGDYPDWYEIYFLPEYIENMEDWIQTVKHLTSE